MVFAGNGGARSRLRTLTWALTVATTSVVASAADWSSTDVQLLHGRRFKLGPVQRDIVTFEHVSSWKSGSNFFFFDVSEPFAGGTEIYGEWYSRLSWSKLGLSTAGTGALQDVSFAGSVNAGNGFRAYLAGVTLHLRVPRFSFCDIDVMAYDDRSDSDVTYIVTPAWEMPFAVGKASFRFRGFVDLIGAEGLRARQLLAQPQVLLDVGRLVGRQDRFFAGIEYQLWHNKYGVRGVDEAFPQLMVLWQL